MFSQCKKQPAHSAQGPVQGSSAHFRAALCPQRTPPGSGRRSAPLCCCRMSLASGQVAVPLPVQQPHAHRPWWNSSKCAFPILCTSCGEDVIRDGSEGYTKIFQNLGTRDLPGGCSTFTSSERKKIYKGKKKAKVPLEMLSEDSVRRSLCRVISRIHPMIRW